MHFWWVYPILRGIWMNGMIGTMPSSERRKTSKRIQVSSPLPWLKTDNGIVPLSRPRIPWLLPTSWLQSSSFSPPRLSGLGPHWSRQLRRISWFSSWNNCKRKILNICKNIAQISVESRGGGRGGDHPDSRVVHNDTPRAGALKDTMLLKHLTFRSLLDA